MWKLLIFLIFVNFQASKSFLLGPYPTSCDDPSIFKNGVYNIYPDGFTQTQVYCEFSKGKWLRVLNKIDRTIGPFRRTFNDYKYGFGTPTSNFWYGLHNIRKMIAKGALEMRIEMNNGLHWIEYSTFHIGTEAERYPLNVVHNNKGNLFDSFKYTNGFQFQTNETSNCGNTYNGGWWFYNCIYVCLTCEVSNFGGTAGHWNNATLPTHNWIISSDNKMYVRPKNRIYAKDCYEIYKAGRRVNGIYVIYLDENNQIPSKVYCDMTNGGWTRILSRDSTAFTFVRNFPEYKAGFGDESFSNSWIGLNSIYSLTNRETHQLSIELSNDAQSVSFILYDSFYLGHETDGYRLYLGKKVFGTLEDALAVSNRQKFMNIDFYDNINDGMCTFINKGGWWYNSASNCFQGCLTCLLTAPVWSSYNAIITGSQPDLKFTRIKMMIRSVNALKDEEELNAQNLSN